MPETEILDQLKHLGNESNEELMGRIVRAYQEIDAANHIIKTACTIIAARGNKS